MSEVLRRPRQLIETLKARKKELFWVWIAYQTIKGLLTTSLIWIPLILTYLKTQA